MILVTRSEAQAKPLLTDLQRCGYQTGHLPTLMIVPVIGKLQLEDWDQLDIIIFVSPNAVLYSMDMLQQKLQNQSVVVAAVGQGTRRALESYNIKVDWIPSTTDGSVGLLELTYFQTVKDKQVLIVKGEGGRDVLSTTLKQRGALLQQWCCYRRCCPEQDVQWAIQACQTGQIDLIVSTSCEALYNLKQMFGNPGWQLLKKVQLLVISQRMLHYAETLGFKKKPLVAESASNQAIIQTANSWLNKD